MYTPGEAAPDRTFDGESLHRWSMNVLRSAVRLNYPVPQVVFVDCWNQKNTATYRLREYGIVQDGAVIAVAKVNRRGAVQWKTGMHISGWQPAPIKEQQP